MRDELYQHEFDMRPERVCRPSFNIRLGASFTNFTAGASDNSVRVIPRIVIMTRLLAGEGFAFP